MSTGATLGLDRLAGDGLEQSVPLGCARARLALQALKAFKALKAYQTRLRGQTRSLGGGPDPSPAPLLGVVST